MPLCVYIWVCLAIYMPLLVLFPILFSLDLWQRLLEIVQSSKMGKCLVSNNIRKLRFYYDEMTEKQLAEKVGVTRQTNPYDFKHRIKSNKGGDL